jgi:hypothetical protein
MPTVLKLEEDDALANTGDGDVSRDDLQLKMRIY